MADARRSWPTPGADTPRRRLGQATLRDFLLFIPLLLLVVIAGVAAGRWAGLAVLVVLLLVRSARLAVTAATPSMRRFDIRLARAGTGGRPAPWRLFGYQLGPFLLVAVLLVLLGALPAAFPIAVVVYIGVWLFGARRARQLGPDRDPMLALWGMEVAWAGDPSTPSGTSERPAPAPAPPRRPARATPGRARPRGKRGRR